MTQHGDRSAVPFSLVRSLRSRLADNTQKGPLGSGSSLFVSITHGAPVLRSGWTLSNFGGHLDVQIVPFRSGQLTDFAVMPDF
jgi:hypothetical protein